MLTQSRVFETEPSLINRFTRDEGADVVLVEFEFAEQFTETNTG